MREVIMRKIKPIALWLGALLVIAIILLNVESDLLWKVQQRNLFLYSSLFFRQTMVVAGGMLSYLGSFFTQFFYHPWMGVSMLCGWWLLLMWLTKRTFCIADKWSIVALIPIAVLLTANVSLGYWVYLLKLQGYFYIATIGTTAGVALLWIFRKLPENLWIRCAFIVLVTLVGYPLMGAYALMTALLMGVWTWRLSKNRMQNAVISATALLAIAAIPLFYYRFVYYQTHLTNIYHAALPVFAIEESYPVFNIPYYLLAICFLAFAIFYRNENANEKTSQPVYKKDRKGKKEQKAKKPVLLWALQGALLAALVAGVWHFWYKDENFHHELSMKHCIEQTDWQGVLEVGKMQKEEPTRAIVMMHNLALSRLGRQCDEMYNFPKGSKRSNTKLPVYMFNTAGIMIYYQYGVMNECHRLCMEEGVEYGWSTETLQYMARTALMNKEQQAARKFLDLLRQTQYYGEWADHMEELLYRQDLLTKDRETGPITHMMHYGNNQSPGDGYVEKSLMTMLAHQDADDPYFQEQAVLGALWTRDPSLFWPRFETYANQHPDGPIPRIFQEAAYFFANMEHLPFTSQLPVDENVKKSFEGFMSQMQQCQGKPDGPTKRYLFQTYGNTYYFEYYFLKNITYY